MRYGQICCIRGFRVFLWFSARLCANGDLSATSPIKSAALQDFIVAGYCLRVLYSYNTMEGTLKVVI